MKDMSRLVLQNWRRTAELRETWAEDELRVREAVATIDGLEVLKLEPGSGVVEFDPRRAGSVSEVKSSLQRALPQWKVYEWSSYDLPAR